MDSSKKFSKVRLLQSLGLLARRFNYDTLEFESSWLLRLVFILSLMSKLAFTFKLIISTYFPKTHIAQLYIGKVLENFVSLPID